ncbi:formate dehydrogenase subunit gamma [Pseudooceanicola sp. CBS1P-1]|uniref:Formate dehydrogenase subunit gamma n=1 Tax=Pseudooceanicola albus TaxID=2692189 RepID=A0A6L7G6W1_9RHOB|nr:MULTISPECIES: formate dehydrogenase subunit gamma [Pseudooceanicola]MBT9383080.1 formate dehydrogenase subunit gamma [Pseudooceanicola endophyticus]MXN19268.1 formate dehydrogenase subunit gamma [Pseudooceanicola albus]
MEPQPAQSEIAALIARHLTREGPMLPILHALREAYGQIPGAAPALIAEALNLSRAEVHGVISFYHDFARAPQGRHLLQICRAEACQAMGAAEMAERLLTALGLDWHGTTPDGALTVAPVYCLGLCACGPAALYDGAPLARLNAARLAQLAGEARA